MARHIAVTGAASGIGLELARLLQARGDDVVGIDLAGTEICADLATERGREETVAAVLRRTGGRLDGLVACAGISAPKPETVSVNYFGAVEVVERLRLALAAAERPRVAVVGSVSAIQHPDADVVLACVVGDETSARHLAEKAVARGEGLRIYPSSKAALARWVRRTSVSPDWAGAGIPVNAVAPGVVLTPMSADLITDEQMRAAMDAAVPMPLNGYAEPIVVAHALAWLVGEENSHITGQVVYVDGGAEASLRGEECF